MLEQVSSSVTISKMYDQLLVIIHFERSLI